jgi:hypothetical protein
MPTLPTFRKLLAAVVGLGLAADARAAEPVRSVELLYTTKDFFTIEQTPGTPAAQRPRPGLPGFRWLRSATRPSTLEEEGFPGDFYATPADKPADKPAYKPTPRPRPAPAPAPPRGILRTGGLAPPRALPEPPRPDDSPLRLPEIPIAEALGERGPLDKLPEIAGGEAALPALPALPGGPAGATTLPVGSVLVPTGTTPDGQTIDKVVGGPGPGAGRADALLGQANPV